jgi:hypothetical protein
MLKKVLSKRALIKGATDNAECPPLLKLDNSEEALRNKAQIDSEFQIVDLLFKISLAAFTFGFIEGLSLYAQGFERSPVFVGAISISFGFVFHLIKKINQECFSNDPNSFLKRHPRMRPFFIMVKDSTGPLTSMIVSIVTTEKVIYKFP